LNKGGDVFQSGSKIAALVALLLPALAHAESPVEPSIKPLILFNDDRLERCGIQASFTSSGQPLIAAVTLQRIGDKAQWVVEVSGAAVAGPPAELGVKTASVDTRTAFSKPAATAAGGFEVRADQAAFDSNVFMKEILIGGATILVTPAGGAPLTFSFSGPVEQSVRQGYLMCSGDLFR
jgi:hypothetical protein